MEICITVGEYTFKKGFGLTEDGLEKRPDAGEAVYSALSLLSKVYSTEDVKDVLPEVTKDL